LLNEFSNIRNEMEHKKKIGVSYNTSHSFAKLIYLFYEYFLYDIYVINKKHLHK